MACPQLFGRGTYFAEDAAKVDQYIQLDAADRKADAAHELHTEHHLVQGVEEARTWVGEGPDNRRLARSV